MKRRELSTDDSDRLPGDPTPAEIVALCREIREVGFQPLRRGAPYHPPWSQERLCNTRRGPPRDGELRVICMAELGPKAARLAANIAKVTLSLS